jgi:hypothetical protein
MVVNGLKSLLVGADVGGDGPGSFLQEIVAPDNSINKRMQWYFINFLNRNGY